MKGYSMDRLYILKTLSVFCMYTGLMLSADMQKSVFASNTIEQKTGILAISIPKCGTHLLQKLLEALGVLRQHHTMQSTIRMNYQNLRGLVGNSYFSTHLIAPQGDTDELLSYCNRAIFIYRDPRDQVVSFAYHMQKYPFWLVSDQPINKLISKLITDMPIYYTHQDSDWNDPLLKDIGSIKNFYDLYKGWHDYPGIYITTFEKLVGAQGGGSDIKQYQEICNIAHYLGIALDDIDIKKIQENLFGGTETFRLGQINSWCLHFTENDKEVFKQVAGQLLIDLGYEQNLNW